MASRLAGGLSASRVLRHSTDGWATRGVAGLAREHPLETGEQIEHFSCLEDAVAMSANVALLQYACSGERVDCVGRARFGSADQLAG